MTELLTELRSREIKVWRDGENLRFSAPTGALTPEFRAKISAQKTEILAELDDEAGGIRPLPPDERRTGVRLSFAQERLWVLCNMEPALTAYNVPHCWRIRGGLHRPALEWALNAVTQRHEILRTVFRTGSDGKPIQLVEQFTPRELPAIPAAPPDLEFLAREEAGRLFDIECGPLWKASLFRFGDEDHALFLTWHHLICDAWSDAIFAREIEKYYSIFPDKNPAALPALSIQYGDFAAWQRKETTEESLKPHLEYWQKKLGNAHAPMDLPTDRPRPARQSYRGGLVNRKLESGLWKKCQGLLRTNGVTPFMFLLAAFKALLARYTGETDLCIGSPIAQRPDTKTERLIGFFLNILPLRTDLSGDPSFQELLHRIRLTASEAFTHQDAPFERIVEALHPTRQTSHHPFFQVTFVLQPAGTAALTLPGLKISRPARDTQTSKFDLTLFMEETEGDLSATMEYATDQFDAGTVERMLESLELLIAGAAAKPDTPLSCLPILSAGERLKILSRWNETRRPPPMQLCLHTLIEAQAERTPDAVAVIFDHHSLSYRELNGRANKLAHRLLTLGVGPDVIVAVATERSLAMVVGLLAVLKAGGAYLPLDVHYPAERLAHMLADARPRVLLTERSVSEKLPPHDAAQIFLDDNFSAESEANPESGVQPEHLAYVIYTSGSTGKPNGVLVRHRNLTHSTIARSFRYEGPMRAFLLLSSYSFDSSVAGIFWTLREGGTLIIPTENHIHDLARLLKLIAAHHVSHLLCLPSFYAQLLEQSGPGQLDSLRVTIVAGETCTQSLVERHWQLLPRCSMFNEYGPTEGTVWSTVYECRINDRGSEAPIGRPISNVEVYVLDPHLQPAPVGVPGEIHLGGQGIARGYLNRPELTARKFIPNPFAKEGRLYKTGDLARWREDGNLQFLGRIDHQVKIRGFRIEIGEVEACLRRHPAVDDVAVIAREDQGPNKYLAAYFTAKKGEAPSVEELRRFAKQTLPDYMIPAWFTLLDALPVTQNGKLDRRALPAPDPGQLSSRPDFTAPRNDAEEKIAAVWRQILKVERIDVHDDFFDLGGHSLAAMQVITRLRAALSATLNVTQIFNHPTIASLADAINREPAAAVPDEADEGVL